jgi:cobalt-zinc-cadmium efflux system outer membrane protein
MKRSIQILMIFAALCARASDAPRSDAPTVLPAGSAPVSIESILSDILRNNASLKAARARWEAMKQRAPQARAWEDLRSQFDTVAGRFVSIPPSSFTDQRLMVEQPLPLSGKNRLRAEAAEAEAMVAFGELRRRELDLAAQAKTAFYQLANASEQLLIVDSTLALLRELAKISRTKYEAGAKPQSDVLAAETDASKLEESRYDVLRQISEAQSRLNVLMNRPAQSPLPGVETLRLSRAGVTALHFDLEQLQALALANRPELLMAGKRIESAQAKVTAARREWIPDPSLRVEVSRYNDSSQVASEVMAGVAINIPWLNRRKYQAAAEEAKQMKLSAEFELEAAQKEALGLVRDTAQKAETLHHHVELFRDRILVLARQNVTATRTAYEANQTSFLNLIDAQRTLQESEAEYWNHFAEYLSTLAELEAIVGTDPAAAHHGTGTAER